MSKQREALQMALKALEEIAAHYPNDWEFDICIEATRLARKALAEPDPTPDLGIRWYAQRAAYDPCFPESPAETDWSTPSDRPEAKPVGTVFGWYGGYPMIELFPSEWIPAVGTVLYSAPKLDAMTHIGYVHPYGIEQLPIYAERGEKWNTPVSSTPFDGAIKVYVKVL